MQWLFFTRATTIVIGVVAIMPIDWENGMWLYRVVDDFESYIEFITPTGYAIQFENINDVLNTLVDLTQRDIEFGYTRHNEIFKLNSEGQLLVLHSDPWLNRIFILDDFVCNAVDFAKIIVKYLSEVVKSVKR